MTRSWRDAAAPCHDYFCLPRGEGHCRHYVIEMQPNACYVIPGEDWAHTSLTELVQYHQTVGVQPFMEILTVPWVQVNVKDLQQEKGMGHGLCPELIESLWQYLS